MGATRVLISGCGRIAGAIPGTGPDGAPVTHAEAVAAHSDFVLAGAADPNADALNRFRTTWNVEHTYDTLDRALSDASWDVVVLAGPDSSHAAGLASCINHGGVRAVVVEKPLCIHISELPDIESLAGAGPAIFVNHSRRFDAGHQAVATWVRSGKLGTLIGGSALYYGGWLHSGVHVVDTLRMIFPDPIRVEATGSHFDERPGDPTYDVDIFIGDSRVALRAFPERHYQLFETDLRFSAGRIRMLNFGDDILIETVAENLMGERIPVLAERLDASHRPTAMQSLWEDVAAALCGGGRPGRASDLENACETMKLLFSIGERQTR